MSLCPLRLLSLLRRAVIRIHGDCSVLYLPGATISLLRLMNHAIISLYSLVTLGLFNRKNSNKCVQSKMQYYCMYEIGFGRSKEQCCTRTYAGSFGNR